MQTMEKPLRRCRVCGLEATTIEDLKLFKKRTGYPHDRLTICKKCNYKKLRKPPDPFLRKCRICGLEALTEEDLFAFTSHRKMPHGKDTLCLKCGVSLKGEQQSHTEELLSVYKDRFPNGKILCFFCNEKIIIFRGHGANAIDNHSLDKNHDNWDYNNKVPSHRSCHGYHHSQESNTAQYLARWKEYKRLGATKLSSS